MSIRDTRAAVACEETAGRSVLISAATVFDDCDFIDRDDSPFLLLDHSYYELPSLSTEATSNDSGEPKQLVVFVAGWPDTHSLFSGNIVRALGAAACGGSRRFTCVGVTLPGFEQPLGAAGADRRRRCAEAAYPSQQQKEGSHGNSRNSNQQHSQQPTVRDVAHPTFGYPLPDVARMLGKTIRHLVRAHNSQIAATAAGIAPPRPILVCHDWGSVVAYEMLAQTGDGYCCVYCRLLPGVGCGPHKTAEGTECNKEKHTNSSFVGCRCAAGAPALFPLTPTAGRGLQPTVRSFFDRIVALDVGGNTLGGEPPPHASAASAKRMLFYVVYQWFIILTSYLLPCGNALASEGNATTSTPMRGRARGGAATDVSERSDGRKFGNDGVSPPATNATSSSSSEGKADAPLKGILKREETRKGSPRRVMQRSTSFQLPSSADDDDDGGATIASKGKGRRASETDAERLQRMLSPRRVIRSAASRVCAALRPSAYVPLPFAFVLLVWAFALLWRVVLSTASALAAAAPKRISDATALLRAQVRGALRERCRWASPFVNAAFGECGKHKQQQQQRRPPLVRIESARRGLSNSTSSARALGFFASPPDAVFVRIPAIFTSAYLHECFANTAGGRPFYVDAEGSGEAVRPHWGMAYPYIWTYMVALFGGRPPAAGEERKGVSVVTSAAYSLLSSSGASEGEERGKEASLFERFLGSLGTLRLPLLRRRSRRLIGGGVGSSALGVEGLLSQVTVRPLTTPTFFVCGPASDSVRFHSTAWLEEVEASAVRGFPHTAARISFATDSTASAAGRPSPWRAAASTEGSAVCTSAVLRTHLGHWGFALWRGDNGGADCPRCLHVQSQASANGCEKYMYTSELGAHHTHSACSACNAAANALDRFGSNVACCDDAWAASHETQREAARIVHAAVAFLCVPSA